MKLQHLIVALTAAAGAVTAFAADTYTIDPDHTYPSFEADHMGISVLRGKFKKTSGTIVLDRAAKTGSMDIVIDAASLDFGHEKLNNHVKGDAVLDVTKFATVNFVGKSVKFNGDTPVAVEGDMTLHGVTKPLTLTINKFKCVIHPMLKKEVCGADASGTFNRSDYGLNFGVPRHAPEVKLQIAVEAVKN
jgi:polyisoprenoid-binding protein YceI